jgi:hypothetical protein
MLGRRCLGWPGRPRHANRGAGRDLLRTSGPHSARKAALRRAWLQVTRGPRIHRLAGDRPRLPVAAGQAGPLREAFPGGQRQRRGQLEVQLGHAAQHRITIGTLGGHRDEALREHDDRLGAPVRGGDELDLDAVPRGEPPGDEEAEPVRVREVEVGRACQLLVDLLELLRGDAQTPVLHLEDEAVGHPLGPYLHPGGGRGEQGGVLDQFGEQVDQVGDRRCRDRLLGVGGDGDPLVVLDLRDRRPDDVDHRDRRAPGAEGRRARHDGQGLGVAAHPGREVVEREQVGELAGTGRLLLQVVDDLQLPVQQGLIPAAEAHQDLPQAVTQPGLAGRRLERGPLDGADGRNGGGDFGRLRELGACP